MPCRLPVDICHVPTANSPPGRAVCVSNAPLLALQTLHGSTPCVARCALGGTTAPPATCESAHARCDFGVIGEEVLCLELCSRHRAGRVADQPLLNRTPLVGMAVRSRDWVDREVLHDRADEVVMWLLRCCGLLCSRRLCWLQACSSASAWAALASASARAVALAFAFASAAGTAFASACAFTFVLTPATAAQPSLSAGVLHRNFARRDTARLIARFIGQCLTELQQSIFEGDAPSNIPTGLTGPSALR